MASINDTLSTAWGSSYVNDFYDRGRIKQVYVQGDEKFRQRPEDLDRWHVRNDKGEMVPFSAFCSTEWKFGSSRLERFNGLGAVNIQGAPAAGFTTGQAMLAMEEIAKRVKESRDKSFTEKNDKGQLVNRTEAMASFGSAAMDNEECWAYQSILRSLGLVYIEHQARL